MNMNRRRFVLPIALIAAAIFGISEAAAQFGGLGGVLGGSRGGRSGGRGGDTQNSGRDSRNERPVVAAPDATSYEQTEYRLSLLQEDLRLSADQDTAWQAFAGKARTYAGDLARERARAMRAGSANLSQTGGLQHIGQAVDSARNRLTALEEVELSARALYQTLTQDQKNLADMRIPTIIAPRAAAPAAGGYGDNLPDLGSGSTRPR